MIGKLFVLNLKALMSGITSRTADKSPGGKAALAVIVPVSVGFALFMMFFWLFMSICEPYFTYGMGWLYFAMFALMVFALCVISTIFTVLSLVFGAKDNELLLSMPIKPSYILAARLLVILAVEYAFAVIAALAAFVPWALGGFSTVLGAVYFIVGTALLPLLSLALSMLFAWVLGLALSKLRRKNIVTLALSLGFLAAYFYGYMNMQKYLNELVLRGEEIAAAFRKAMPPFYAFGAAVAEGSLSGMARFVCWTVAPFAVMMMLLSRNYAKILTTNRGAAKILYKEGRHKQSGVFAALVRKEFALYWSKPMVVLNASFASLILIAGAVGILLKGDAVAAFFVDYAKAFPMLADVGLPALLSVALVFIGSMNNLSSSLISLEGRHLWIAKSIPVSAKTIFAAKLFVHWILSAVPCLIASVCAAAATGKTVYDWLLPLVLPQAFVALMAIGGLIINLHFPKFDWVNETAVVKQGASAMITMFGGMGLILALGSSYALALANAMSLETYLWVCAAGAVLASGGLYGWLSNGGERVFLKL